MILLLYLCTHVHQDLGGATININDVNCSLLKKCVSILVECLDYYNVKNRNTTGKLAIKDLTKMTYEALDFITEDNWRGYLNPT